MISSGSTLPRRVLRGGSPRSRTVLSAEIWKSAPRRIIATLNRQGHRPLHASLALRVNSFRNRYGLRTLMPLTDAVQYTLDFGTRSIVISPSLRDTPKTDPPRRRGGFPPAASGRSRRGAGPCPRAFACLARWRPVGANASASFAGWHRATLR